MIHSITQQNYARAFPKAVLVIFLLLFSGVAAGQQEDDGVYIIVEDKDCIYRKVEVRKLRTKVCVADKPILPLREIAKLGDILVKPETGIKSLEVRFSERGREKLELVSRIYPGDDLAFILEGKVVFLIKLDKVVTSGLITLNEDDRSGYLRYFRKKISGEIGL
ncbi:MAG: hypothetical protein AAF597_19850 [Bacteroidota bacterium]